LNSYNGFGRIIGGKDNWRIKKQKIRKK